MVGKNTLDRTVGSKPLGSIAALIAAVLIVGGCGSMAVDKMLACTSQGLVASERNDEILLDQLENQIRLDIEGVNQAFDRDVDTVAAGVLKSSDGKSVLLDSAWVKEARLGYFLLLESKYRQLADLERTRNKIKGNAKTVRQLIQQSRELNKIYLTNAQGIQLLLEQLGNQATEDLGRSDPSSKVTTSQPGNSPAVYMKEFRPWTNK